MDAFGIFDDFYDIDTIKGVTQNIIYEFFKDNNCGEDKLKILENVFSETKVEFAELDWKTNALADYGPEKKIQLKSMYNIDPVRSIGLLLHEYSHMLSNRNYNGYNNLEFVEEGIADTFADVVFNHYLKKHGDLKLANNKIQVDIPYVSRSGYFEYNAFMRTMLYVVNDEQKSNQALMEYVAGDKLKMFQDIYSIDTVKDLIIGVDFNNDVVVNFRADYGQLYNKNMEMFKGIDTNSIYYQNNYILPRLELQSRCSNTYIYGTNSNVSLDQFKDLFDNKKLYEVDLKELDNVHTLIKKSNKDWEQIANYFTNDIYKDETIMKENSHEIFQRLPYLINQSGKPIDNTLTILVSKTLKYEYERIAKTNSLSDLEKYYIHLHSKMLPAAENARRDSQNNENHILYEQIKSLDNKLQTYFQNEKGDKKSNSNSR